MIKFFFKKESAILLFLTLILVGCNSGGVPKPRGYFRIDMPTREYQKLDSVLPYTFDYPKYSKLEKNLSKTAEPYWLNVYFPNFNARIHISYKEIKDNLYELYDDNIRLAYNHVVKADAIEEHVFIDENHKLYGMLFEIKGDAASPLQFFATDSVHHFLRGSLYFQTHPNKDSLAPVIDFLTEDVVHLLETIRWKNQ